MNVEIYQTQTGITKAIEEIKSTGKKFDTLVHRTAVSILAHAIKLDKNNEPTKDISKVSELMYAMPKSGRTNALIQWFGKYGIHISSKKVDSRVKYKANLTDFDSINIEHAMANPYWLEVAEEGEIKPMNIKHKLKAIVTQYKNRVGSDKQHPDDILMPDLIDHISKTIGYED